MLTRFKLAAVVGVLALLVHPAMGIGACLQNSAVASECAEDCGMTAPNSAATQIVPAPTPNSSCCQASATKPESPRDTVRPGSIGFIGGVDACEFAGQPAESSPANFGFQKNGEGRAAPSLQVLYATFLI